MSYMRWTSKSTGKLATELVRQGFKSPMTPSTDPQVAPLSLQAPSKQKEGAAHPDRNAQFNYLNKEVGRFIKAGQPVVSVDTKKKEIVGELSNGGTEWHPAGEPTRTKTHDFVDKELVEPSPMGSMTWPTTRLVSSATRPTPPPSPSRPSDAWASMVGLVSLPPPSS